MEKDAAILELIAWLKERAGDAFRIVDNWEADRRAIGFASSNASSQLAYVLSLGPDRFHVTLETAPLSNSSLPFEQVGQYEAINREQVLAILTQHLRLTPR
jgi:hypothetical protein